MSVHKTTDTTTVNDNSPADPLVYRFATIADCDSLATVLNSSYRGELSLQGWTHEDKLIFGPITNTDELFDIINSGKYIILVFFDEVDQILKGCVCLLHKPESKTADLGMFAVRPDFQTRGYGKFILSVAENYSVNNWNVEYIALNVFIQRPELIAYYNRRGYTDTGEREPFSTQLLKSGYTLRDDLEMCTMIKTVKKKQFQ